jgi:DNA-binding PadR family transcriptional regulator
MLEDLGYVAASNADGRKTYAVTEAGQAFLEENASTVADIRRRIEAAWGGPGAGRDDWHAMVHELSEFAQLLGRGRLYRHHHLSPEAVKQIPAVITRSRHEIEAILEAEIG